MHATVPRANTEMMGLRATNYLLDESSEDLVLILQTTMGPLQQLGPGRQEKGGGGDGRASLNSVCLGF